MNQREVPKPSIPAPEQMEVERFGENDDQYIVGQRLPLVEEFVGLFQEKGLEREAEAYRVVADFAAEVQARGGAAFLVGGCVRDHLAGKVPKDFDIEVFGLEAEEVGEVAAQFGEVSEVGKAFGIRKLFTEQGFDLDISLPRTDSKTGDGHTDVEVTVDPFMSIKEAARRRDFTINTLCANPLTGDIYDPHGGVKDLEEKILRVTDAELFADDPLRVMRGIQFVGRFDLAIDPESYEVMRDMVPHLKHLSRERFVAEWQKLLLKSEVPSKGLKMAMEMGIFHETYPDFPPLAETEQDPEFHPEGDVWTHTLMVVDKGAEGIKKRGTDPEKAFTVILADLCHDLGKPATTEHIDGHIRALGHEAAGVEPTERFLDSIGIVGKGNIQRQKVLNLVRDHMMPHQLYKTEVEHGNAIGKGAIRRLAARI
ncbi:MAG: CCA tRNA nucleotidyltransferase, partial [Candidatus Paceibacterota bacterium]